MYSEVVEIERKKKKVEKKKSNADSRQFTYS